ncbi:hypothetical protein BH20CHL6_BH20CHL6_05100 [soil metagenome]
MDQDGRSVGEQTILEGTISVVAALTAGSRPIEVVYLRDDRPTGATQPLARLAASRHVRVERVPVEAIDARATGRTHGGVIALAGPRRLLPLEELAAGTPDGQADASPDALAVMLDGVEDPFNFGSAVRSLYAAGVDGLVLRPRNWLSAAGVVARASAGASELMPTAIAETAEDAAAHFRARGFGIWCATQGRGSVSLHEAVPDGPVFLLIGGEKRGVTRSFMDRADILVHVPYGRPGAHSLGTAAAAAVIAFELLRRRTARRAE